MTRARVHGPVSPSLEELLEQIAARANLAVELDRVPCGRADVGRIVRAYARARGDRVREIDFRVTTRDSRSDAAVPALLEAASRMPELEELTDALGAVFDRR